MYIYIYIYYILKNKRKIKPLDNKKKTSTDPPTLQLPKAHLGAVWDPSDKLHCTAASWDPQQMPEKLVEVFFFELICLYFWGMY